LRFEEKTFTHILYELDFRLDNSFWKKKFTKSCISDINCLFILFSYLSSTSQYLFMCSIGFWFMSKFGSFSVAIWPSQEKMTITVITPIAQRIASIMFLPKNPPAVLLVFLGLVVDLE